MQPNTKSVTAGSNASRRETILAWEGTRAIDHVANGQHGYTLVKYTATLDKRELESMVAKAFRNKNGVANDGPLRVKIVERYVRG